MLGNDYAKELVKILGTDQIEKRFGGRLADKKSQFFPPDMTVDGEEMMSIADFQIQNKI
jgi:hypothetical protein